MTDPRDPLVPFDDAVFEAVADESAFDGASLRGLVRRHQEFVQSSPGVRDLVYEWRKFLPYDPLVARTDDAYHLVVMPRVWEEFGGQLDLSADELAALRDVHDRQARRAAGERGDDAEVFDGAAPVVLARDD